MNYRFENRDPMGGSRQDIPDVRSSMGQYRLEKHVPSLFGARSLVPL